MLRVLVLLSPKGGVGKTSLCANVAVWAARLLAPGRVLVVDLDPSGDLGSDLGYRGGDADDGGAALADALLRDRPPRPAAAGRAGLDVLAGGPRLRFFGDVNACLASDGVGALAELLMCFVGGYVLVVVDCPAGLGPMVRQALAAATGVVIPTRGDDASLAAIGALAETWRDIRANHNPNLVLLGVALTQIPAEARHLQTQLRDDLRTVGEGHLRVFRTAVRANDDAAREARRLGVTADEYAHHPQGADGGERARAARGLADDYRHLTAEILARLGVPPASPTNPQRR